MTTFKELLRQAKSEPKGKLIPRPINLELQKSIDELNEMFVENWTTLFDENKDYELWREYTSHIYFGEDFRHLLKVNKTPINKIEILPVNWLFIKEFTYSPRIMYVIVLRELVRCKLIEKFREAIAESGLSEIFDEVPNFDSLLRNMNNVLGDNTVIEEFNNIKFKDIIIPVPELKEIKACYSFKNEELFDIITSKNYKEVTLDYFNLLNNHEQLYPILIKLLKKLKELYLDEVHTYYKEEYINCSKSEFEILCEYDFNNAINPNDYILVPVIFKNKLTWDIRPKGRFNIYTYYLLNHWSTHKNMKAISREAFYESFASMIEVIKNEAIRSECNVIADKIVVESLEPLKQLNLSISDLDNDVEFNGHKISVKTKDGKLTLKHKDYTFHVPYYSPNSVHTYFEKENKIDDDKTWVTTREEIQSVADLFIEFLNS